MSAVHPIIEQIRQSPKIPVPSQTIFKVLELTRDPQCDLHKVAILISRDAGLTAQVLRQANSALYGYGAPTSSVPTACSRLGLTRVRAAVVNHHVVNSLATVRPPGFNASRYWQAALATSVAAQDLCARLLPNQAEHAGTAGLLCDIGIGLLAFGVPERYRGVLTHPSGLLGADFVRAEARMIGVTHPEVGAAVLADWKLDQPIIDAVRQHHVDPLDAAAKKMGKFNQAVAAGVTLSRIALDGSEMDSVETLFTQVEALTPKPDELVGQLLDTLVHHIQETAKTLSLEIGSVEAMQGNFDGLLQRIPDVAAAMSTRPMSRDMFT
jgi:HD-like signal output (HDOD) protein